MREVLGDTVRLFDNYPVDYNRSHYDKKKLTIQFEGVDISIGIEVLADFSYLSTERTRSPDLYIDIKAGKDTLNFGSITDEALKIKVAAIVRSEKDHLKTNRDRKAKDSYAAGKRILEELRGANDDIRTFQVEEAAGRIIVNSAALAAPLYYNSSTNTIEDVRDQIALMCKTDVTNVKFNMARPS